MHLSKRALIGLAFLLPCASYAGKPPIIWYSSGGIPYAKLLPNGGLVSGDGTIISTANLNSLTSATTISEFNAGSSGASLTINFANSDNQTTTLTANCTFTLSNPVSGKVYLLRLVQDGTGSRTVTWPGAVLWPLGVAPMLSTVAGSKDIVTLYWNGTNYYGNSVLKFQ